MGFTETGPGETIAPPPPPAPPPGDAGFTEFAPAEVIPPPPPPPPDPLQSAVGGLQEEIQFIEQNTQLPTYDPIAGYSEEFFAEGLDTFGQTFQVEQVQPAVRENDYLGGLIEEYNQTGVLGGGYVNTEQLQRDYDANVAKLGQLDASYQTQFDAEANRLQGELQKTLGSMGAGEGLVGPDPYGLVESATDADFKRLYGVTKGEYLQEARLREQFAGDFGINERQIPGTLDIIQRHNIGGAVGIGRQMPPSEIPGMEFQEGLATPPMEVINAEQRHQDALRLALQNDVSMRQQDPFYDAFRYEQEKVDWNAAIDAAVAAGNSEMETYRITDPFARDSVVSIGPTGVRQETHAITYYDEYGNQKTTFSPAIARQAEAGFAAAGGVGITDVAKEVFGNQNSIKKYTPGPIKNVVGTGLYVAGREIEAVKYAWGELPEGAQSQLKELGRATIDLPQDMLAGIYAAGKFAVTGDIPTADVRASTYFNRGQLTPEEQASIAESQERIISQYRDVPVIVRLPAELALGIWVDPLNLVAPLKWGRSVREGWATLRQRRSIGGLVEDAFAEKTVANQQFLDGVSLALEQGVTSQDVYKQQFVKGVLGDLKGLPIKGDEGLIDEFTTRTSYRLLASDDASQTSNIIIEELGRARDIGLERGLKISATEADASKAGRQLQSALNEDGVRFWDEAFAGELPAEVNLRATDAWRAARDELPQPDELISLQNPGLEADQLVRWGSGPEDLYSGRWFGHLQISYADAEAAGRAGYVAQQTAIDLDALPPTKSTVDWLEREFKSRLQLADDWVRPTTNAEATAMANRVRGIDAGIPAPPGRTAQDILQSDGYADVVRRSYDSGTSIHTTPNQLLSLDVRSRVGGINLYESLAQDSPRYRAFTKERAGEILDNMPATERQQSLLRDLSNLGPDGKRLKTVKRRGSVKDAPILRMDPDEIGALTYNQADDLIERSIGPKEPSLNYIYSVRNGDLNARLNVHAEQRVKLEMGGILDELLIAEGKPNIWTDWHTQRLGPRQVVKLASDLLPRGGKGMHSLLDDHYYGGLLRELAEMRDTLSTADQYERARLLLAGIVETAQDAPVESTGRLMNWVIEMTEKSVKTRRFKLNGRFAQVGDIDNPVKLAAATRDLMMRRAVYVADLRELQRYQAFADLTGISVQQLAKMTAADALRSITNSGAAFIQNTSLQRFKTVTREFFGTQQFSPKLFLDKHQSLQQSTGRLGKEIRDLETRIEEAAVALGDPLTARSAQQGTGIVHDRTRLFAEQLGIKYNGPEIAYTPPQGPLPITSERVRNATFNRIQKMNAARQDSTAEIAKAIQDAGMSGNVSDIQTPRTLPLVEPDASGRLTANINAYYSRADDGTIRSVLDGTYGDRLPARVAAGSAQAIKRKTARLGARLGGNRVVTFETATDEALWKMMRGDLSDDQLGVLNERMKDMGLSVATRDSQIIPQLDQAVSAVWTGAGDDAPLHIAFGQVTVEDPVRDKLLRAIKDAPPEIAGRVKGAIGSIHFNLDSGTQAATDWANLEGFNYWDRLVGPTRPSGQVFSPYAAAVGNVDWARDGGRIDRVLNTVYETDPVWNPPGKRVAMEANLSKMSKTIRMGDDTALFGHTLLQMVQATRGKGGDPYRLGRQMLDGLVRGDEDAARYFAPVFNNSQEGQRWLRWLRTKNVGEQTNWDALKGQWDTFTPHFGANTFPQQVLEHVADPAALADGRIVFRDMQRVENLIHSRGRSHPNWDGFDQLERDAVESWADGLRARWEIDVPVQGSAAGAVQKAPSKLKQPGGAWKDVIDHSEFDAALFTDDFMEPVDVDRFLDNMATSASEIEARRIGYNPDDVTFAMKVMYAVKGNLGFFWLGLPPRYLVYNLFGNIFGEISYATRTGSSASIGRLPREVQEAWASGALAMPRELTSAIQSQVTDLTMAGLSRQALRDGRRSVGRRHLREIHATRAEERATGGATTLVPRLLDKSKVGKAATFWSDGMAYLNENAELWSRRRIYGKELWGSFQSDWGYRLDEFFPDLDPALKQQLQTELSPAKVASLVTAKVADPRLKNALVQQHAMASSYANLQARHWTQQAMRDYRMRNRFDTLLDKFSPYHFWSTKNLMFMAATVADRPAVAVHGMRAWDKMSESWDEMPDSWKGRLKLFRVPEQSPAFGGQQLWLRPTNITNPALFTAAMTVSDMQDAWNRLDGTTLRNRLATMGKDGLLGFYEGSGIRFGPQWEFPVNIMAARAPEDLFADHSPAERVYDTIFGRFLPGMVSPSGYRPDQMLPLAGLEQLLYGVTDDIALNTVEDLTGADLEMFKLRNLNEYANQVAYGSTFTRQDVVILGKSVMIEMLKDGEFGEVTRDDDGNLTGVSDTALENYYQALIDLNEENLDNPHVQAALGHQYRGDIVTASLSVAGAPVKFLSTEWEEAIEVSDEYFRIREEQGPAAANVWMRGEYNRNTSMYESGQAIWLPWYWAAGDDAETLQEALNGMRYGAAVPVTLEDGTVIDVSNSTNNGLNALIRQNNTTYWQNKRAESTKFFTKADPVFDKVNAVDERYDTLVAAELAKDNPNMVMIDMLDRQARRAKSDIFRAAEDAGVNLDRPRAIPAGSSRWWKTGAAGGPKTDVRGRAFFEEVQQEFDISHKRQQDIGQRESEYVMDMVVQQLGLEKYTPDGEFNRKWTRYNEDSGEWFFDQEAYNADLAAAAQEAPALYREMVKTMANDPDSPMFYHAPPAISPDIFSAYVNEDVIPELEEWRQGQRDAYGRIAAMESGPDKDAAIAAARREYGGDFYQGGPKSKLIIDNVAGDIATMLDDMPIAGQQEFVERYDHLFDERGNFSAADLTKEDVFAIAAEFELDLPLNDNDLEAAADGAYLLTEVYYNVLSDGQKEEWRGKYGDEESASYIPGLFVQETRTDRETGEEYDIWVMQREALHPDAITTMLTQEEIDPAQWDAERQMEGRPVGPQAIKPPDIVTTAIEEKHWENELGRFWSGEAYLTPEEMEKKGIFDSFQEDHPGMEERAQVLREQVAADDEDGFTSWEDVATFAFDPELEQYIRNRIVLYDQLAMGTVYDKRTEYLVRGIGQELLQRFPDEEALAQAADFAAEPPDLSEMKTLFDAGEPWLDSEDELSRWEQWNDLTNANADIERLAQQYKKDMDVTWKELGELIEDPDLKAYIQARNVAFEDLGVAELWEKAGQWLTTGAGQGLYKQDPDYFDFYLSVYGGSDGASSGGGSSKEGGSGGGSKYSRSYGSYRGSGGGGRGGGSSYGSRSYGFARSTIENYSSIAQEVFFLDEAMVGGTAADSEQRMHYAQLAADRLTEMVGLVGGLAHFLPKEMMASMITPLLDAVLLNIKQVLGDAPTLESWLAVLEWLGVDPTELAEVPGAAETALPDVTPEAPIVEAQPEEVPA